MSRDRSLCAVNRRDCAQRLTASKVCPDLWERSGSGSTPVLNALRHQRYVQEREGSCSEIFLAVLNALRHQRYVQAKLIPDKSRKKSAQRLTASKVCPDKQASYLPMCYRSSAQRLTASKVCPVGCRTRGNSCHRVLNALRHQRYVQGYMLGLGVTA